MHVPSDVSVRSYRQVAQPAACAPPEAEAPGSIRGNTFEPKSKTGDSEKIMLGFDTMA